MSSGAQDSYFKAQPAEAIKYGKTIHIRPWRENNGNWYWYSWSSAGSGSQMIQGQEGCPVRRDEHTAV